MKLFEIGRVGKPHGFRGEFVVTGYEGTGDVFKKTDPVVYIGSSPDNASSHPVEKAVWMPKGWKLKLSGIDEEAQVKAARGHTLFVNRETLPSLQSGEFYVAELVGARVVDAEKGVELGTFIGVEEPVPGLPISDRWWISRLDGSGDFSVPAVTRFVDRVDSASRTIYLKNFEDLILP